MDKRDMELPPRPGEQVIKQHEPTVNKAVPLYVQGKALLLTEEEALGIIAQLSSALQTRKAWQSHTAGEVIRNG